MGGAPSCSVSLTMRHLEKAFEGAEIGEFSGCEMLRR